MITHTKKFGIYHWDTFDNTTLLVGEANTAHGAVKIINRKYKGRIKPDGADQVDIVDRKGNVVNRFKIG